MTAHCQALYHVWESCFPEQNTLAPLLGQVYGLGVWVRCMDYVCGSGV